MNKALHLLKVTLVIVVLAFAAASCSSEKTPQELFDQDASGVVVILNRFYYELHLANGKVVYFTGLDDDGNISGFTTELSEVKNNMSESYGTGFFVSKKGLILTNRHVVQPVIDQEQVKKAWKSILEAYKSYIEAYAAQLSNEFDQLNAQRSSCFNYNEFTGEMYADESALARINERQEELRSEYQQAEQIYDNLSSQGVSNVSIVPVCQLGIAYNGTMVNSSDQILTSNPCSVVRVSGDEDVDLALIQLNTRKTPGDVYLFATAAHRHDQGLFASIMGSKDADLTINQSLYMIGYNAGPILAKTKSGIRVQMTSGKITQLPDSDRLLYDIPTLHGSSGSPVLDAQGNLVAVNYAKLGNSNFNFGIPVSKIEKFLYSPKSDL